MPAPMEVVRFSNTAAANESVLNAIRGRASLDYQHRIPAATQANITEVLNALSDYTPSMNEFSDALVNLIGMQIIRSMSWTNPLAKFKRGLLTFGETIEEIGVGLLPAYVYSAERESLEEDIFGREPNEVQTRFHKINRRNRYKLTINESQLQRAFFNQGGLNQFVTALMGQINTSDQVDEFTLMCRLFREYYDREGFYTVQVPDLKSGGADLQANARVFLTTVRELTQRIQFVSRKYNAAKLPSVAQPDQLELFMTPRAQAVIDVEALSAAFNVGLADISARTTIIPEENFDIPGAQAILTVRDFFVVADNKIQMTQSYNPVGLHQNYHYHHWQTISASPFVPAILLSTEPGDEVIVVQTPITGIGTLTLVNTDGDTVNHVDRGDIVKIEGAATANLSSAPAGWEADNTGLGFRLSGNESLRTRVTSEGYLIVGTDEAADSVTVTAFSVYDQSFTKDITVAITGPQITGSIGQSVDENTPTP